MEFIQILFWDLYHITSCLKSLAWSNIFRDKRYLLWSLNKKIDCVPRPSIHVYKVQRNRNVNAGFPSPLNSCRVFGNTFEEKNYKDSGTGSTTRLNCVCRAFTRLAGRINVHNRALRERVDVLIYSRHSFTRNSVRRSPVGFAGFIFNRSRAMLTSNRLKEALGVLNKTPCNQMLIKHN